MLTYWVRMSIQGAAGGFYVATAAKPSVVTAALMANFTGPNDHNLIVAYVYCTICAPNRT
jgi:hypothetical protein